MLSIQITEQYLKVVFTPQGGSHQVPVFAVERIQGLTDAQISGRLTEVLKRLKVRARSVVLALARNTVTVRNLHLPSQDKEEIRQMVDLNVIRIVPYKKEEIVFSYLLLGLDEVGYTRAILAIVKIDVVRRIAGIVEKAGLLPDRIVLGSYGTWKKAASVQQESPAGSLFLALDVDTEFVDFLIFSSDQLLFTRSINIGARALAENGEAGFSKFIGELRQFLMMFYNEEMNRKPARGFLCGAKTEKNLAVRIEAELGLPIVQIEGAPDGALADVSVSGLERHDPRGGEQISFMLPEIQLRNSLSQTVRDLILFGGACIYILTMVCGLFWGRLYSQENYLSRIEQTTESEALSLGDLPLRQEKTEYVKNYLEDRKTPLFILSELQKTVPAGVALTAVTVDEKNRVTVRGQASELADVFKFIDNLEKAKYFKNVQTRSTKKKKNRDRDLTDFELSFTLG